ncbi:transforming growth factor beta receptor type 3-like [Lissotriton helveticus]
MVRPHWPHAMLVVGCLIPPLMSLAQVGARTVEKPLLRNLAPQFWQRLSTTFARSGRQENITEKLIDDWSKANLFMAGMKSWGMKAASSGIEAALTVTCRRKKMVAQVRKDILVALGYSRARLTLQDPECTAESNYSHFLLSSPLTSCGTLRLRDQDAAPRVVLYQNAILLWRLPGVPNQRNGSEATPRPMEEELKVINFTCVYLMRALPHPNDQDGAPYQPPRSSRSLFSLEVCSSRISSRHPGPCMVASNSRVFVEVFPSPLDPGINFSLQMCFVSPSSDPWVPSEFLLICRGCPADSTVTFSTQHFAFRKRRHFSFQLRPVYNESIQFLHCRLVLDPGEAVVKACDKEDVDAPEDGRGNARVQACTDQSESTNRSNIRIISKPIIVTVAGEVGVTGGRNTATLESGWKPRIMKNDMPSDMHVGLLHSANMHQALGLEAIVGIVFAAFVIGALLMAGLWFIYSQTDPDTTPDLGPPTSQARDKVVKDAAACTAHG